MWHEKGSWLEEDAHGGRWACPEMDLSDSWGIVTSLQVCVFVINIFALCGTKT